MHRRLQTHRKVKLMMSGETEFILELYKSDVGYYVIKIFQEGIDPQCHTGQFEHIKKVWKEKTGKNLTRGE